jgi:mono/diheme cytochrome c family protein
MAGAAEPAVEFNRDIRPILSNNCYACHGPDNGLRKAKLRLDRDQDAQSVRGGSSVLVPGKPADSELWKRITSADPSEHMPPKKSNKELTKAQIALLGRWIEQGGKYQKHWSLLAPVKAALPPVKNAAWAKNPIDHFVQARLEAEHLAPAPGADRRTLLRRLSFDLTGLPPTPAEVDAFSGATDPRAYEMAVDRLLASPHFGERLALFWLDLVRFADTGGYHSDNHRDVSLYRDWVIGAFNHNLPFDQFTTQQLAGDLLPGATPEQKIASGYNRLLQTTEEGGAQAKEYQAKYYADRVRNISTVWLGLTLGCIECHDHKYDPFTTKEFYQLEAFFADIQERSVGRQEQTPIYQPGQKEQLDKLDAAIVQRQKELAATTPELDEAQARWEADTRERGTKGLPKEIVAIFAAPAAKLSPQQKQALANYYRANVDPSLAAPRRELAQLQKQKADLHKVIPTTLVTVATTPRPIRILPRGNWLDASGAIVQPGVPESLPGLDAGAGRATRLDLARWLVAPDNPLTARIFVNRLWALYFGQGIVKTLDDFGAQGSWPTHPELLDWLAVEFAESGWNVKHVIKLMVTSSTYRQSSHADANHRGRDPGNTLVSRQAHFRLDAEIVRDNALAVSGLLVRKIGGPSVKPYQPAGYWRYLNFPTREWANDAGADQYRRGLYTYWQRSFPHPSLLAFDAPSREECTVERTRSNTPQQALVLLNDPTYVEAARALAETMFRSGKTPQDRVDVAFRQALQRPARVEETKLLTGVFEVHLAQYQADTKAAQMYLQVGARPAPQDIPAAELAAWMDVARVVLNLHETITRE